MDEEKKVIEERNIDEGLEEKPKVAPLEKEPVSKEEILDMLEEIDEEKKENDIGEEEVKKEPEPKIYTESCGMPAPRLPKLSGPCLTMFRESTNERETGQIVYKGEDALPFVNDHVMLVADGLGGASSIRHVLFNRGLFEEDEVYDTLFGNMFGEKNPELEAYVIDSFGQLISARNLYDETPRLPKNLRKGGYFASRIIASIFLNQVLNADKEGNTFYHDIMEDLPTAGNMRKALLESLEKDYSKRITDILHRDLLKAAENANLVYESKYTGVALLGTTLTATIFNEVKEENRIDAFYFQAGDSRPYVLDEEGLKQAVADQENEDSSMTNFIHANDEEDPFYIDVKYRRFKTPCILFNASDGCFDSLAFVSQLAFEKLILETIVNENSYEAVSATLKAFFEENGHHDDSSTIAMRFFGFDGDYKKWQEFAKKRLEAIKRDYLNVMPDLLNEDYAVKLDIIEQQNNRAAMMLIREFKANEAVLNHYRAQALADYQENFDISLDEVNSRLVDLKALALDYMDTTKIEMKDGHPIITPFSQTENPEAMFDELTANTIVFESREPFGETDHAIEDAKIIASIIRAYNYYKELEVELNDMNRALENAPKFLDEDFKAKGGKALLNEYVDAGIYTKEQADELLVKFGVNNEDVPSVMKKKEQQAELFAKYDAVYESLCREE